MSWRALFGKIDTAIEGYEDHGLSVFLFLLVLLSFGLTPFVGLVGWSGKLVSLGYTLLFIAGAFVGGMRGVWRALAIGLALAAILCSWIAADVQAGALRTTQYVSSILYMLLLCGALMRQVFRPGEINSHRIRGAVAVYLLLGFVFAMGFVLIEQSRPGAFSGLVADGEGHLMRDAVYLSFVTLTTLGYGDVTPVSDAARTIVLVEAIVGQLFLVILIGRLVSLDVARASGP